MIGKPILQTIRTQDHFKMWRGRAVAGELIPLSSLVETKHLLSKHYQEGRYVATHSRYE